MNNGRQHSQQMYEKIGQESRVPPQAVEVEESVLGGMILEDEAFFTAFEKLSEDDFYKPAHQQIFRAFREIFDSDKSLDLLTLENHLRDKGLLDTVGGAGYLAELTRSVSSAANIDYHAQILSEKATKRNLILSCTDIIKEAYNSDSDPYDVLEKAERKLFEVLTKQTRSRTHESREIIEDALEHMLLTQESESGVTGIPTGLDIDNITAGWQDSNMIVIAARPSMGKTAFLLHCLKRASEKGKVALLSLETSYRSIGNRLIITEAGIDGQRARKGILSDNEIDKVQQAASHLLDMGIIVDDTTDLTATKLRAKGKALKKKYDIQALAIDFIQLMKADKDSRHLEVSEVSRACKLLCKELDIPVFALSQLSRSCEYRNGLDQRPRLADLKESGDIEQDADVVVSLFRPEKAGIDKYPEGLGKWSGVSTENICEIIVNKQKDGPTGMVRHTFIKESMQFKNYTSESNYMDNIKKDAPF